MNVQFSKQKTPIILISIPKLIIINALFLQSWIILLYPVLRYLPEGNADIQKTAEILLG